MSSGRRILSQGDRDGACFLYGIANGIQALTNKPLSQGQWDKCIQQLPFRLDDFLSSLGTEKLDDNWLYFEAICNEFLRKLRMHAKVVTRSNIDSSEVIERVVSRRSAMLAAIGDGEHWVAIVDAKKEEIYMACSATFGGKAPYSESRSPRLNRVFNLQKRFNELRLYENRGLIISQKKSA